MERPQQSGFRLREWGADPVWETFDVAVPGPGEVLIGVEACSVGLTVLNWAAGDLTNDASLLPVAPGHELVGTVLASGDAAYEHLVGHRVVTCFYLFCGICRECVAGRENTCLNLGGWVGLHRDGGYSPFTVLPGRNAVLIGDSVDPRTATVIPDAVASSVHMCLTRARVAPQDRVVVIGAAGGVGAHLVQVARHAGASVVGLDVGAAKLGALERLGVRSIDGADLANLRGSSLWDAGSPTVVVDLVGDARTLSWGLAELGVGGRLVMVTTFRGVTVGVDPREMVTRELSLLASRGATRSEYAVAAELVAQGAVQPVIGMTRHPRQVLEIHEQLQLGTLIGRGAIVWGDA